MQIRIPALLSTAIISSLALPSNAQPLPPSILPSALGSTKAIIGSNNSEKITRTDRMQWLLRTGPQEAAAALLPSDAAHLSREMKLELKFEEQLASESRSQIEDICRQLDVLDAVGLAVAMEQVNAYADQRREERYLQVEQSISAQGRAAFEDQLSKTASTLVKYAPDIVAIASAMPDAYKHNVRVMCQTTPKPSPQQIIPAGTQVPQIAG